MPIQSKMDMKRLPNVPDGQEKVYCDPGVMDRKATGCDKEDVIVGGFVKVSVIPAVVSTIHGPTNEELVNVFAAPVKRNGATLVVWTLRDGYVAAPAPEANVANDPEVFVIVMLLPVLEKVRFVVVANTQIVPLPVSVIAEPLRFTVRVFELFEENFPTFIPQALDTNDPFVTVTVALVPVVIAEASAHEPFTPLNV